MVASFGNDVDLVITVIMNLYCLVRMVGIVRMIWSKLLDRSLLAISQITCDYHKRLIQTTCLEGLINGCSSIYNSKYELLNVCI
jgi:succinate-acetate transporter protein